MDALEDYNSIEETMYLLRSPANAAQLRASIAEFEGGKLLTPLLSLTAGFLG